MRKLTVKKIVEFRRKSERSKKTFITNLKLSTEKISTGKERDYWVRSLSAIKKAYKTENYQIISDKIEKLEEKLKAANYHITKIMYQQNLKILRNYQDFDFKKIKPIGVIKPLKTQSVSMVLTIRELDVEVKSQYVFSFQNGDVDEVGAIWFIAQKDGFKQDELGMFADVLYRYLKTNFKKFTINPQFCIAVDTFNKFEINYSQILEGEIPRRLSSTLDEIKKMM